MGRLVVISFGKGSCHDGFPSITVKLGEPDSPYRMQFSGSLPPASGIAEIYRNWKSLYSGFYQRLSLRQQTVGCITRNIDINKNDDCFEIEEAYITNISEYDIGDLCEQFSQRINAWLNSPKFRKIDQQLRTQLKPSDDIRFILETNDELLRRLPWHLWNFFEDYPFAEVALSSCDYRQPNKLLQNNQKKKIRILAIFGNSQGIDISQDRFFLEQLSHQAEIEFLVEPNLSTLNEYFWLQSWDILFFAGHSSHQKKCGLHLNQNDTMTLQQLKYAIRQAISRGLKLAIFNSCEGLGLAQQLEDLHIPQVIVMREPVPDVIAQEFLKNFLSEFSQGKSLYTAMRLARERLQGLEGEYPCATWLPIICQNPAEPPMKWNFDGNRGDNSYSTNTTDFNFQATKQFDTPLQLNLLKYRSDVLASRVIILLLIVSLLITTGVMGLRHFGLLQPWELSAYDRLVQMQPIVKPDTRLLLITIDEADIQYQLKNNMNMRWSLSDEALAKLLEKLEQYQPQTIGIDIYRDFKVDPKFPELEQHWQQNQNLFGVCKISVPEDKVLNGTPPPPSIDKERVGFSDFVEDDDGIPRRQLLHTTPPMDSPCLAQYSFSYQLAKHYLNAKGIKANINSEQQLQIGDVVFKPLQLHSSGYQQVDASGYQVILNYRPTSSSINIAPQLSLRDILSNPVSSKLMNAIKNHIVIVGVTASSTTDRWNTPLSNHYSPGSGKQIPGVYVQAQMVSHILSAVLDKRPLIWWWSGRMEALWVWVWGLLGGIIAWRIYQPFYLFLSIALGLFVLFWVCFSVLTQAGWIPLVPTTLVFILCALLVKGVGNGGWEIPSRRVQNKEK